MKKYVLVFGGILMFFVGALSPTKAQVPIDVSIGAPPSFGDDTKQTASAYSTAVTGQPAPFNATPTICGSDTASNCSASWVFNYTVPSGDTIVAATLTLGIWDIDSAASGNQVASYSLDGSDDLTSLLNSASEGLNGGTGSANSYYNVLTITIPSSYFTDLNSGAATIALALQGPGLGVLGTTTDNGAGLVYSSLDMEAMGAMGPTPEPSTYLLLLAGLCCFALKYFLRGSVPA